MAIIVDIEKGKRVAAKLCHSFLTVGIHGRKDMPEDVRPRNVAIGSLEHLLFMTLTVSIDYQRDAPSLWESSRRTYNDPETRYLFNPRALYEAPFHKIIGDLQRCGLSRKPKKDAEIWRTIGVSFYKKWNGSPVLFLEHSKWDAEIILERLESDRHPYGNRRVIDFPYLRGPKIGPLWLRMLRDNVGLKKLEKLEKVPIAVDVHIARATLATGVVKGQFKGDLKEVFNYIREAWFNSVEGLEVKARSMIALDIDEPLWHLSKYGCTMRNRINGGCPSFDSCAANEFCVKGKIKIEGNFAEIDT